MNAVPQSTGETVDVGNYSFEFNMTYPHELYRFTKEDIGFELPTVLIRTFYGKVWLTDWSFGNLTAYDATLSKSDYYLDYLYKNITGMGNKIGKIYVSGDIGERKYKFIFDDFDIQSTLNLTLTTDFFKDVKIERHLRTKKVFHS